MTTRVGGGGDFRWILDEDELLRGSQVYLFVYFRFSRGSFKSLCVQCNTDRGGARGTRDERVRDSGERESVRGLPAE